MFSPNDQQYLGLTDHDGYVGQPFAVPQSSFVAPELNFRTEEMRKHTQWASDMKIMWGMLKNEFETKGAIVGILTKLEEKYQVRG